MALINWYIASLLSTICHFASGKALWSTQPANFTDIIRTAYPVGNGQLAALMFGTPGHEKLSLNRDSLWSGGPFENSSYAGGNPPRAVSTALPGIRDWIFQNGTGNVSKLMGSNDNYGSYYVLGNLSISLQDISNTTSYIRSLELDTGIHSTSFMTGNASFNTTVYCSYPDSVCVYEVSSTRMLPVIELLFENVQANTSLVNSTCSSSSKSALLDGITQANIGMIYKAEARILGTAGNVSCSSETGVLRIEPFSNTLVLVIAAGTNYDETKGDSHSDFSFRGTDPGTYVAETVNKAASKSSVTLKSTHLADFNSLIRRFTLTLPDPLESAEKETSVIISPYNDTDNSHTDPYLEGLQFEYGRYLFISSSRNNSLPPNLQGKWAYSLSNAWGADYHANINLQMNYWGVDATGLGELQSALWTYMAETWSPRGSETAKLLYDAPGWVTHDEMNIFGHTGMKTGDEYWADYPASAAWMMLHVADYFDYSQDLEWLRNIGYPMLKAIAQFWINQLQEDEYFHDGTLVVNPCSSPEHGPTTFGCTHYQQLIYSLFTNTLTAATALSEPDNIFIGNLTYSLAALDKGLHIGNWGQIQEWKLDLDVQNDTHRHLSHLVGWYPGSSLSSYLSGYATNATISSAVRTSLESRGPGIGADANAGWEKVWRAACWARLNDSQTAYAELRLALKENMAVGNLLSMYDAHNEPFQIDANFGYVGAVLAMLVVDLPLGKSNEAVRAVVLGPAIPTAWAGGSVEGLRLRGGGIVDFAWDDDGVVTSARWVQCGQGKVRAVNKQDKVLLEACST